MMKRDPPSFGLMVWSFPLMSLQSTAGASAGRTRANLRATQAFQRHPDQTLGVAQLAGKYDDADVLRKRRLPNRSDAVPAAMRLLQHMRARELLTSPSEAHPLLYLIKV